jgi:hypothetical protein
MRKIAASKFKAKCVWRERGARRSIFGAAKRHFLYLAPDEALLSTGEVWALAPSS